MKRVGLFPTTAPSTGVTSVSFTGGIISVANPTTTPAFTVAGTSGGIPYFNSATSGLSSAALGANLPVFGGGAGAAPFTGTRTGNTTLVATSTGTQTSGRCVEIDANGNHIAAAFACATPVITMSCQTGIGDGLNAIPAGTYPISDCYNAFGATWTLTSIRCYTDAGSSTMAATNGGGTALLTGAVTCTNAWAAGTQSGTTTIASADYVKFSFVADGTAKQTTWVVTGTR